MSATLRTYFWDFFGPRALPTAQHFKKHLAEFLERHQASELAIVEVSLEPGHHGIGLQTPELHWSLIEKALRPKRFDP